MNQPKLLDDKFKIQKDFILDPSKLKALFATRRFGKSYTAGLYLLKECQENPGVTCLYIALTRESAKKIMFKDVLKVINRKYKLGIKFNNTTLECTFPNGSVLYLMGMDSSEDEKDKALGQKYKLAVIDECASFSINMRELVYTVLKPAMTDLAGTICMIGTPGNITKGLFYDVTTGKEPGWHVVKADTHDNPYMREKFQQEINDLIKNNPLIQETPGFKQMYLGKWEVDDTKRVYKFSGERNVVQSLPIQSKGDWTFVLGVDLGFKDASAFSVVAYHQYDPTLYVVESFKKPGMDITDVAEKIKELSKRYPIYKVVVDGSAKQAVEEMQRRHNLTLTPADKQGKVDFIEIMNSEFIQARIKLIESKTQSLMLEYDNLIWNERSHKKEEHSACENHLADATLYAWRYTYQYYSSRPPEPPKYGTPQWAKQQEEEMWEAAEEYARSQQEQTSEWDWNE